MTESWLGNTVGDLTANPEAIKRFAHDLMEKGGAGTAAVTVNGATFTVSGPPQRRVMEIAPG